MKTFKNNQGEEYLFIEVPKTLIDDRYFVLWSEEKNSFIVEFQCEIGDLYQSLETENECYIISTTKDITEEIAESIVELIGKNLVIGKEKTYKDYHPRDPWYKDSAKSSLHSLLHSLELKCTNYLILKKI